MDSEFLDKLRVAIRRPDGSFFFRVDASEFLRPSLEVITIFAVAAGQHFFMLERSPDLSLTFYHASPGTGTSVARVSLTGFVNSTLLECLLNWSPALTRLTVGDAHEHARDVSSDGVRSRRRFRVSPDGDVFQVGDDEREVVQYSIFQGGNLKIDHTAEEGWTETINAVNVLLRGNAAGEPDFEPILANFILAALMTGFEVYCKRRFCEIEGEGITPDFDSLARAFLSRHDRETGKVEAIRSAARERHATPVAIFVEQRRVDFQNFASAKRAFRKAYGIKFGALPGIEGKQLKAIQHAIRYRHRIIHVSPNLRWLNQPWSPPEPKIMAGRALAEQSIRTFDTFIRVLHQATLDLRPNDDSGDDILFRASRWGDSGGV